MIVYKQVICISMLIQFVFSGCDDQLDSTDAFPRGLIDIITAGEFNIIYNDVAVKTSIVTNRVKINIATPKPILFINSDSIYLLTIG